MSRDDNARLLGDIILALDEARTELGAREAQAREYGHELTRAGEALRGEIDRMKTGRLPPGRFGGQATPEVPELPSSDEIRAVLTDIRDLSETIKRKEACERKLRPRVH